MNKSKQILFNLILVGSIAGMLTGCASSKKITYFQDQEGQNLNETLLNYEPTLQYGDILTINVTALETDAAIPFNIYESRGTINKEPLPYIVNADGEINFPIIGKISVSQKTTKELTNELTELLQPYLKKPIVNIRLVNFKVTVLGEVKSPGSFAVMNERISIIEALGLAGDLTIYAKRNSITLIRETDGKRTFVPVDITSKELFNSPYFYLAQNDVIYVEPNKTRVNSSAVGPNTSVIVAAVSILITAIAIFVR